MTLPPLLDRALFFGNPKIAAGQLSPDGRHVSFVQPLEGVLNLWVKPIDAPFEAARPVTARSDRPVTTSFWRRDGHAILFVQDQDGDENHRVYAVDPEAAPDSGSAAPPARDLTPYENVRAEIYAVPRHDPGHILIGLNDRDPTVHDVWRIDLETGARELVLVNEANVASWVADLDGRLRLGWRQTADGGTELLRVDGERLVRVFTCTAEETCQPLRFHADGRRLYLATDCGDADRTRLVLLDPASGTTELVEEDPEGQVDFGGAIFSSETEQLIATSYVGDRVRLYPREERFASDLERLRAAIPDRDLGIRSMTDDGRLMLVTATADVDPGSAWLYHRDSGAVELLYRTRPELPTEHLASMEPVRYRARDGVEIPAYLTVPRGVAARDLPAIVFPHGGPWVRDAWGYHPIVQFLANRGYAVLQPNYRGSTGFGKRFLHLGDKQWGTGAMQHDVTDGAGWLTERGIAAPGRIGIMGGSYGGYAALAGVAFTPEIYAAGVSIVGPSSIPTLLASIPPYWAPLRRIFTVRVGDPDDPAELALLKAQSPLYAAERIKAPLLVVQGANDPRVKRSESDQIVAALRELGREVRYLVALDEGHGFAHELNNLALFAHVERFLARHLDGRCQPDAPPAVVERMAALEVDVDDVAAPAAMGSGG